MSEPPIRRRVTIHGRVQGVFFRDSTRRRAIELGLAGWVRNCSDGTVEAVFEGPPQAVSQALDYVTKGPEHALVDDTEINEDEQLESLSTFEIR